MNGGAGIAFRRTPRFVSARPAERGPPTLVLDAAVRPRADASPQGKERIMTIQTRRRLLAAAFGGALILAGAAAPAAASDFRAMLNGDGLLPAGDSDGWGRINIDVDDTLNLVCADIEVRSLGEVTATQIMRGEPGHGSPVVNLDTPDDDGDEDDCDTIGDALADEIQANPGEFYVEIRTTDFPHGAIRGQLEPSAD
jgi:hypothetical protein